MELLSLEDLHHRRREPFLKITILRLRECHIADSDLATGKKIGGYDGKPYLWYQQNVDLPWQRFPWYSRNIQLCHLCH